MGDVYGPPIQKLLHRMKDLFAFTTEQNLKKILQLWETIYGTTSEAVVGELTTELEKHFKEFWDLQCAKLIDVKNEYLIRIDEAGKEAVKLERDLGLKPQVNEVPQHGTLVQMEEQLLSLLESYQDMKNKRLKEYFIMQKKEKELCSVLDMKTPKYKLDTSYDENQDDRYVPTSDDIKEFEERICQLNNLKEELEYDFEGATSQLRQLLEELDIVPTNKMERAVYGDPELPITKKNYMSLMEVVNKYKTRKEEMVAEADHLREQIDHLSKKMFKDVNELKEFLTLHSGFTERTIKELKGKLNDLKEERRQNLKELIASSRDVLTGWWDRCCFSDAQRDEFTAFKVKRLTEDILEIHELEIENLEKFYNKYKKIFALAKKHEELWDRLLHLEDLENDKDRLFNNRGGCLLKEERERKVIQKRVPAITSQLMMLLDEYKEETGKDFTHFGEPLKKKIREKEYLREISKQQGRMQRKTANTENIMVESRLGAHPVAGTKRKAPMTPLDNRRKSMRTETSSPPLSSTASSTCVGTVVKKEKEKKPGVGSQTQPMMNYCLRTPTRIPAASTPQNGSLSYESFQEHIEKSTYLAHNSTRNHEHQRVLRQKNLNQTRTVNDKTPKTPGKIFTKTPSKTPSKIPFRIPTGSKIPSHVPPVSPRKPLHSTTKLPIIF